MALPKLNQAIRYDIVIPSLKRKVTFRPYFVKEEKILLQAFESKDEKLSMRTMIDTIVACVYETVNPNTLTTYDVEYLFTQIRARSVGETSELTSKCQKEGCESDLEIIVDLTSLEVTQEKEVSNIIQMNDDVTIELRYPTYLSFVKNYNDDITTSDFGMNMVSDCILSINTPEERITEWSESEINDFVDSMTSQQFKSVSDFIDTVPTMKKEIESTCNSCGHINKITLEGLSDFF
jgi:hypothetical protein